MNELERRLKRSLTEVRDAGRAGADARASVARDQLMRRLRRRRVRNLTGSLALAGALSAAAFLVVSNLGTQNLDDNAELGPADVPPPAQASVSVGDMPTDVSVGGLNYVWTANSGDGSVSRIDPDTNEVVSTVQLPAAPGDIGIGEGPVWVSLPSLGQVVEVSPSDGTIADAPIPVAGGPVEDIELSVGAGALWAVVPEQGLTRVDLESRQPVGLEVDNPIDVAVRDEVAWALTDAGTIVVLDSSTGEPTGSSFEVEASEDGELTFAGGYLWHLGTGAESLLRLDPATGEILGEVDPRGQMMDFVIDPEVAWTLSVEDGRYFLTYLDRDTLELGDEIEVDGQPTEAVIAGGSLWLSLSERDSVLRFSKLPGS